MTNPDNPKAPHVVIIGVETQVMEQLPTGELTGKTKIKHFRLFKKVLKDFDEAAKIAAEKYKEYSEHVEQNL